MKTQSRRVTLVTGLIVLPGLAVANPSHNALIKMPNAKRNGSYNDNKKRKLRFGDAEFFSRPRTQQGSFLEYEMLERGLLLNQHSR